jgi:hypothetical protein
VQTVGHFEFFLGAYFCYAYVCMRTVNYESRTDKMTHNLKPREYGCPYSTFSVLQKANSTDVKQKLLASSDFLVATHFSRTFCLDHIITNKQIPAKKTHVDRQINSVSV